MYLAELIVVNYRSCKHIELALSNNEPNIFIGINDCGKTTLLKTIGLLLDDRPAYNYLRENSSKKDFSNSPLAQGEFENILCRYGLPHLEYNSNQTVVLGKFRIEENDIIDEEISVSNQLLWSIENIPENIWLARILESDNSQTGLFILTMDTLDNIDESANTFAELWSKPATDLNKRIKDLNITKEEIENVNKRGRFSNLEKIRAIYSKGKLETCWSAYKIERNDKLLFPVYRYLDWNCSLEDIKKTAVDAMATKIDSHIIPLRSKANEAAREVEKEINEQLKILTDTIGDMIPNITDIKTKIYFEVKETITDILINKLNGDGDIHLDLQGEGVKRQIWFALIKSGAMASIASGMKNTKFIWAFDEPETHLYPAAQRQFFEIIKEVTKTNVQALISTHSTIFIDKSKLSSIKNVSLNKESYTEYSECETVDEVFESLELRNSDFLFYDKFLVIEGDTEEHLIPELYKLYKGSTLSEDNIQLVNLRGKNKWLEGKKALENVLSGFKKSKESVIYLFDSDMKEELGEGAITEYFFFAGKQDIEDSISNIVWVEFVKDVTEQKVILLEGEIQTIKDDISDEKTDKHDKFFSRLEKLTKLKLSEIVGEQITYTILHSKGNDSAQLLIKHITSIDDVSPQIKNAFDKLTM